MDIYNNNRELYDAWDSKHKDIRAQIKELQKQQLDETTTDEQHDSLHRKIEELYTQWILIEKFLADLGVVIYRNENGVS